MYINGLMTTKTILKYIFMIAFGILIAVLLDLGITKSIIYFFIGILIISLIRVWQNKHHVLELIRSTETVIFNKPLEKDYWNKGELKNTKVQVQWKKNKTKKKK